MTEQDYNLSPEKFVKLTRETGEGWSVDGKTKERTIGRKISR